MDINQIKYLLTVVDNDFNLTKSAEVLHVSQPAISKSIKDIEFKKGIQVFKHKKGRIVGLTHYGMTLVNESRKVYQQYVVMMEKLNQLSEGRNGTIRIGIAPVINSIVFSNALLSFINTNPGIELKLVEDGAYSLQRKLVLGDIDLAVIVSPATIEGIYENTIYESSVRVWFNKHHRFNQLEERAVSFAEIEKEKIVTLTDSFMVTFQLNKRFRGDRIHPNYFLQTVSWDLVLNLVQKDPKLIGILAAPIGQSYSDQSIKSKEMEPTFPWKISLCNTV
ncbi:LysR family transcriptional regulator, partial [Lactobacillus sp. XV13L]|nr:LysR family transcriptional regulator [Lactobacillus sp. XV13L]